MSLSFLASHALQYTLGTPQTIGFFAWSIVNFDTVIYDKTPGDYNTSTYIYTVPQTGVYNVSVDLTTDFFDASGLYLNVNGNTVFLSTPSFPGYSSSSNSINGQTNLLLTAGDSVSAYIQTEIGSGDLLSGVYNARFSITSLF